MLGIFVATGCGMREAGKGERVVLRGRGVGRTLRCVGRRSPTAARSALGVYRVPTPSCGRRGGTRCVQRQFQRVKLESIEVSTIKGILKV